MAEISSDFIGRLGLGCRKLHGERGAGAGHGGEGVRRGAVVERLYREIRALRIYEGASEVQKVVIARQILAGASS